MLICFKILHFIWSQLVMFGPQSISEDRAPPKDWLASLVEPSHRRKSYTQYRLVQGLHKCVNIAIITTADLHHHKHTRYFTIRSTTYSAYYSSLKASTINNLNISAFHFPYPLTIHQMCRIPDVLESEFGGMRYTSNLQDCSNILIHPTPIPQIVQFCPIYQHAP